MEFLWIFFIIFALQPVLVKRWQEAKRMRALGALERHRKSRVIGMIHRQETMSLLGFPVSRFIDIEDSEQVLRAIDLTDPKVPIDLVLHTPGGMALAAEQIAFALRKHPSKVTVFVPHYAMSGGMLVALGADEIVMSENAVLGPVDPQLGQSPAVSILKVMERKPIEEIDDETIIQADVAEKALRQMDQTVRDLIGDRLPEDQVTVIAHALTSGKWTHDYPIRAADAKALGFPVSTSMPKEVLELMQLYPQTSQRRPSVEYNPVPYGPADREDGRRSSRGRE